MIRKAATPASTTSMKMPAARALPEKMRSPRRRTGRGCCSSGVAVTLLRPSGLPVAPRARSSARDLVDDLLGLLLLRRRDRRGPGGLGGGLLTVRAEDVAEEVLQDRGLGGVL